MTVGAPVGQRPAEEQTLRTGRKEDEPSLYGVGSLQRQYRVRYGRHQRRIVIEDPAPYWVTFPVPYYDSRRGGWPAVVVWRDGITGHQLCAESEQTFSTYAEALLESHYLGDDRVILERLLAARPRDLDRYWREVGFH